MTILLIELSRETITTRHLYWLDKLARMDYFGMTRDDTLKLAALGRVQLYGFRGDAGLIITEILVHAIGKELFVYALIGGGIFTRSREVFAELRTIANQRGCTMIGGLSQDFQHSCVFKRLGMLPIATRWMWRDDAKVQ